jgi:hypothetical protein
MSRAVPRDSSKVYLVAGVPSVDRQTTSKVTNSRDCVVNTPYNQMNLCRDYPDLVGVGSSRWP